MLFSASELQATSEPIFQAPGTSSVPVKHFGCSTSPWTAACLPRSEQPATSKTRSRAMLSSAPTSTGNRISS